jgi:hypothetical protein
MQTDPSLLNSLFNGYPERRPGEQPSGTEAFEFSYMVGGSSNPHHLSTFERSWDATGVSRCWQLWEVEFGQQFRKQQFRGRERGGRPPSKIRFSDSDMEVKNSIGRGRSFEVDNTTSDPVPSPAANSVSIAIPKHTARESQEDRAGNPTSFESLSGNSDERYDLGDDAQRTEKQFQSDGDQAKFRGNPVYAVERKRSYCENEELPVVELSGIRFERQSELQSFSRPSSQLGGTEFEGDAEDVKFLPGKITHENTFTPQDRLMSPMSSRLRNDTIERDQNFKFTEVMCDQRVEQFRNLHVNGMAFGLHVLSSSLNVIPELFAHDTPQEPGAASDRTDHGSSDQGTPEQLGGIQVHSEDRLEEVFLMSYSEKNATKICWKKLKPLQ